MALNSSQNPIINGGGSEKIPIICEFCYNTLEAIHKSVFQSPLDSSMGIEFFNILLFYFEYFGYDVSDGGKKESNTLHLLYKGKPICSYPIKSISDDIGNSFMKKAKILGLLLEKPDY